MINNWKNVLVHKTITIQDSLKIIDSEVIKIALVIDENEKLIGTVTDGDIRRAIINKKSLQSPVYEIMNKKPVFAENGTSRSELVKLMLSKKLSSIPILSEEKIIGIELLEKESKFENPVFLMAGGFGTRLKPLTDNCPKPLLKVGDKPILETLLLNFKKEGFYKFYISTHYLPQMIMDYFGDGSKWGVEITYVHESNPLGTGGALGLLPNDLPNLPLIVINGDVLTKIKFSNLLNFHNENSSYATMCVREYEYQVPFGVVESEKNKIKSMVEKPIQRFHVNAGIYVLSKGLIDSVQENEIIDMPTLFERNLERNITVFPFHDYWLDIGRMDDFKRAQIDIQTFGL